MSDTREDITELVRTLVLPLVDDPDAVELISSETEDGSLLVEVRVADSDAGKVIGRQGRVIKAIRTLSRAAGFRNGVSIEVELYED